MATLKYRGHSGYGWLPNVRSVEVGRIWNVHQEDFAAPGKKQPDSLLHSPNTDTAWFDHGIYGVDPDRTEYPAMELLISFHDDDRLGRTRYEIHVVAANECWLLGDDGKNIDRIP